MTYHGAGVWTYRGYQIESDVNSVNIIDPETGDEMTEALSLDEAMAVIDNWMDAR
jgi:hypothetical protein